MRTIDFLRDLGCALLGGVFVWAGGEHFLNFKAVVSYLSERRFAAPAMLLSGGSTVEIVAGLSLVLGFARPYAAAALIVFTVAASIMLLNFWRYSGAERQALRSAFIINVAVIGGLTLAAISDVR